MDGLKEILINLIKSALLGFDDMVMSAQEVLTDGFTSTWDNIVLLSDVLKPFCYVVIAICLYIEIAQVITKVDIVKFEHGIKICVKMILAKVCIDIAPTFLRACYLQASAWINLVGDASIGGITNFGAIISSEIEPIVSSINGMWGTLGAFISVFVLIMAIKICGLMVLVIAYGRMFELFVYLAISPLPCAFFPLGDGSGGGFSRITGKFFKSFAAVCLQGVLILVCMRVFGIIMSGAIDVGIAQASSTTGAAAISELCYVMLLGSIVLVMSITKCGSWAKAILDAA